MASLLADFCRTQYQEFCALINSDWGVSDAHINVISPRLKAIHRRFLAIACTASIASYRRPRGEYAASIIDGCQLAIVLSAKGAENSVRVLLRQSVELALKHIYFVDHPVEYSWAQTRADYRQPTFQGLLEYLKRTEEMRKIDAGQDIANQITSDYAKLSRYVHVKNRKFHSFSPIRAANRSKVVDTVNKMDAQTSTLWPALIVLLTVFSERAYTKASQLEKRLVRSGMKAAYKSSFDRYLRSLSA